MSDTTPQGWRSIPGEQWASIVRRLEADETVQALADELGLPRRRLSRWINQRRALGLMPPRPARQKTPDGEAEPPAHVTLDEEADGTLVAESSGTIIRTLAQLLERVEADMDAYYVHDWKPNTWTTTLKGPDKRPIQVTNYQIKAWLKPIKPVIDVRRAVESMLADLRARAPKPPPRRLVAADPRQAPVAVEICIMDLHVGMLAWGEETGEDYDSGIAEQLFLGSIEKVLERTAHLNVVEWVLPIGHDLLHVDTTIQGAGGATTRGTPQDVDDRWQRVVRRVRWMFIKGIMLLRERARVLLKGVPGNHDEERSWALVEMLDCYFHHFEDVVVDNSPKKTKFWSYGQCLVMMRHGHKGKRQNPALVMATAEPELWAASRYREVHEGHFHAKKESERVDVIEERGVRCRTIPSLAASDRYHADEGYLHLRTMEAFVWHAEWGMQYSISVGAEEILQSQV